MEIAYLEVVTPDVDATCASYQATLGVAFSPPQPALGGARVAPLSKGGQIGIRAPMRADEAPVVRPYWRVPSVDDAVQSAVAQGAHQAHPPMDLPGVARFAITLVGPHHQGWWTALDPTP